ncbi:MAG: lipopolysaccharide biosynthesis protein [Candidatus Lokiarchaeota archaeon]|nr:lipopolysaccharide biosynthesis protein [Candidatus Lokiarchaeota archaeon]
MKHERRGSSDEAWEAPGFHRPLGGMFFNILPVFLASGFGLLFNVWLIPSVIFPFPEAMGYQTLNSQIFGVFFTLFDMGIGIALYRFIAEKNVSNPKRTIDYIRFFVFFQMITGAIQVTGIAIYVFGFLQGTGLSYAAWFFLIYSTVQFPGMMYVFNGALQGYQRFDKSNLLSFLSTVIFENSTRVACILLGRWLGSADPSFGEVMGAAAGSIIGVYVDDFISAAIGAHWLHPILKKIDPSMRIYKIFIPRFDRQVVKDCFSFGARVIVPTLIWPAANFVSVAMLLAWMPNYSTYIGIFSLADLLSSLVYSFTISLAPPVSEAWNNGKVALTKYYLNRAYQWYALTGGFMAGLLVAGAPLLGLVAGPGFELVVPMLAFLAIFKFIDLFAMIHDSIYNGLGHPEWNILLVGVDQGIRLLVTWLLLVPFPSGWYALVWALGLGRGVKWIVGYAALWRKYFHFRINWWQSFVATGIAMTAEVGVVLLLVYAVHPALTLAVGELISALVIILASIILGPFLVFMPVYAMAGGWDDEALAVFEKAVGMSGPSKGFVLFLFKITKWFTRVSRLHGRFPSDVTGVQGEIEALIRERAEKIEPDAPRPL